jgi:enoyl-CoA hydratase/carnithine racemase
LDTWIAINSIAVEPVDTGAKPQVDAYFALPTVLEIILALESDTSPEAQEAAAMLRKRSPLMLHVVLEQIRRGRALTLADDLRMERGMVRHCFTTAHLQRTGATSETVEGIRALAIDKDHAPRWNPERIEDVTPSMVMPFFDSPWPNTAHPLQHLD